MENNEPSLACNWVMEVCVLNTVIPNHMQLWTAREILERAGDVGVHPLHALPLAKRVQLFAAGAAVVCAISVLSLCERVLVRNGISGPLQHSRSVGPNRTHAL